jgi:asparagine synthase (glutamine-hydrolysing)
MELRVEALLDLLPETLAAIDHPSGDGVNAYVIARAVRAQGLKVALSGLGGDEIFGGYPSFRRLRRLVPAARRWGKSPRAVRRVAAGLVRAGLGGAVARAKLGDAVEGDGTVASLWPVTRQLFSERERQALLPESRWGESAQDPYRRLLAAAAVEARHAGTWTLVSYAEARAYMHDVLLRDTDQMSMAHALEVRVPFLDHRLVELVVGLPESISAHGAPKSLLAESLALPLPASVVQAPKRGFTLPFDSWMRGALRPLCEAHLGEQGLDGRGLLRAGAGRALWQRFLERRGVSWSRVWMLVALNAWLERAGVAGDAA